MFYKKLNPKRKLDYLKIYMDEWIDKWPHEQKHHKIKPFVDWLESKIAKEVNKGIDQKKKKDAGVCQYCGRKFDVNILPTTDHVVPSSKGGYDIAANKLKACSSCNSWKADKTLTDWLKVVKKTVRLGRSKEPYEEKELDRIIGNVSKIIDEFKNKEKKIGVYKNVI